MGLFFAGVWYISGERLSIRGARDCDDALVTVAVKFLLLFLSATHKGGQRCINGDDKTELAGEICRYINNRR